MAFQFDCGDGPAGAPVALPMVRVAFLSRLRVIIRVWNRSIATVVSSMDRTLRGFGGTDLRRSPTTKRRPPRSLAASRCATRHRVSRPWPRT